MVAFSESLRGLVSAVSTQACAFEEPFHVSAFVELQICRSMIIRAINIIAELFHFQNCCKKVERLETQVCKHSRMDMQFSRDYVSDIFIGPGNVLILIPR